MEGELCVCVVEQRETGRSRGLSRLEAGDSTKAGVNAWVCLLVVCSSVFFGVCVLVPPATAVGGSCWGVNERKMGGRWASEKRLGFSVLLFLFGCPCLLLSEC